MSIRWIWSGLSSPKHVMKKDMEIPRRKKAITFGVTSKILLTTIGYRGNYYRDELIPSIF